MHPKVTNGAVEKPNSSAPKIAAIATSLPVFNWPSVWRTTLDLKLFITKVWCVSAIPSSQGRPACFIDVNGEAPVPPS